MKQIKTKSSLYVASDAAAILVRRNQTVLYRALTFPSLCFYAPLQYSMMTSSAREIVKTKAETHLKTLIHTAEAITASADVDGEEFPFVRVPRFELLGSQVRSITKIDVTIWAPLVTEKQREEWSNFSATEIDWYNESLIHIHHHEEFAGNEVAGEFRDEIWEGETPNDASYMAAAAPGPFAPLWQISPPTISIASINYNLLQMEFIRNILPAAIQTNDCVMSALQTDDRGLSESILSSDKRHHQDHEKEIPFVSQLTPVFEQLLNKTSVVGFILTTFHWEDFLANIFTSDVNGVAVVIRNTCNESVTFKIVQGEVGYS